MACPPSQGGIGSKEGSERTEFGGIVEKEIVNEELETQIAPGFAC